jgi:signal transduction histidine kinase
MSDEQILNRPQEAAVAAVFAAMRRILIEHGFPAVTPKAVADSLGISVEELTERLDGDDDVTIQLVIDVLSAPLPMISAGLESASTSQEVLESFIGSQLIAYEKDFDAFQALFFDQRQFRQHQGQILRGKQMARLPPLNDRLFAPTAKRLAEAWGDDMPAETDPRRLVFIANLAVTGLLAMKGMSRQANDPLRHSDDDMIRELAQSMAAPISALGQLKALNRASAELAQLRTEDALSVRVPELMRGLFGASAARLVLGDDVPPTDDAVAVHAQGKRVGALVIGVPIAAMAKSDQSRLTTFANMVSLALDNVRFYASLESLVEERTRELRQAQAALVQSEKMAALGQLVAGVAHELNTPIGAIHSAQQSMHRALEMVADALEKAGDPKAKRAAKVLNDSADVVADGSSRVDAIVKRLARFARLDKAERERVDLHHCIDDAVGALGEVADGITIERSDGELPEVTCSPAALNQVLLNVLSNAAEAGARTLRISTAQRAPWVEIAVHDDGGGIAPEHLEKIFDPGFTTKGVGVGSGLGLSICHQIVVNEHGGELAVDSTAGGTRVTMRLPLDAR